MFRTWIFICLLGVTPVVNAQIYADASSSYTHKGSISEIRAAIFINARKALSVSGSFYTDGVSYETFPRIGILNLLRNKEGNYNIVTYGLQVSGIGAQRDLSLIYDMEFLRVSPFINLRTPIFQIKRDCKCGKLPGLLFELVGDLNLNYPSLGLGIRKGFD
jgi:hypothetical protein